MAPRRARRSRRCSVRRPAQGAAGEGRARRKADLFVTYCTNAVLAAQEVPGLKVVAVPDDLNVAADYGLTVLKGKEAGGALADYVLSAKGQAVLNRYGFTSP